jgi:transcriptional regulator with XRE-family HTH domain
MVADRQPQGYGGSSMNSSHIGTSLKAARERLGWSRETLAHHSGVSWSAIAQIESGRRRDVRSSTLSALAEALGVSVDYLIGSATATAPRLLEHRLLTYSSDEEYLAAATPFLADGVERADRLLVVTTRDQTQLLRDSLSDRADDVEFADSAEWYRSPTTAMHGYLTFVNRQLDTGAAWIRVVAEIAPESRSEAEIPAWTRYESFVNIAFASAPVTVVCAYDDRSWPEDAIDDARRTHPEVVDGVVATANRDYRGPEDFLIDH